jgi:hypothetical protein
MSPPWENNTWEVAVQIAVRRGLLERRRAPGGRLAGLGALLMTLAV